MKTPILGSSYVARSINAANNRMVNLYPEAIPEGGKEPAFLQRTPGLRGVVDVGDGPIRGMWPVGSFVYVVSGQYLYKISTASYTDPEAIIQIGLLPGSGMVSMSDNGIQLFIAANGPSYIYNTFTDVFAKITDPDFPGAVTVGYLDGYFVFNEPNSEKVWVTSLLDGTSVDPLDFASAEGSPDDLVAVAIDHLEAWLFGVNTIEIWRDVGGTDFPLARIQGAFIEIGCAAKFSVAKLDNSLFWLGSDARGNGIVYRANGYTGVPVSTRAIEWQIQQYDRIDNAIAFTYQQDGHPFYVLTFPTAKATWVYDASTQVWHERAAWNNGKWARYPATCMVNYEGKLLVGDYFWGAIYELDMSTFEYDGSPMRWLRSWRALPPGQNDLKRSAHHTLQLDCESGTGLDGAQQGADPQVMLRWSDDGGHTWSNEHWASMGKIGEHYRRVIWRRLGMTLKLRDRVYEVSGTDPVKVAIMGAELMASPTNG